MDKCVMCGRDLPTECGSMICQECCRDIMRPIPTHSVIEFPKNNVEISIQYVMLLKKLNLQKENLYIYLR